MKISRGNPVFTAMIKLMDFGIQKFYFYLASIIAEGTQAELAHAKILDAIAKGFSRISEIWLGIYSG
ncbi:MAG: hypothetical protein AMJ88_10090 [Anaerolineae bacterium SM23_ 63]|nr:MAG: hypothetical protein AMJ88_10090 [Anaerolineae bacterium SM23_ 63]HEY46228.1 hypothetical protein [Anaerolineae bacterium]